MMGKQEALYLLVKSLSTGEKSLVRQMDKGKSGYLVLFDLIARQRQYDERKLKKKLQEQSIDINFAYAKNYLGRHILRCLREGRDGADLQVSRQVEEIEILMDRKVYGMVDRMLGKAIEKSVSDERFQDFLKLSALQINRILSQEEDTDKSIAAIGELTARRAEVRAQLKNLGDFEDLFFAYQPISKRKRSARNQVDLAMVDEFRNHALLQEVSNAESIRAKRLFYKCRTHILAYAGELSAVTPELEAAVELFRTHEFLLDDHPVDFLNDLARLGGLKLQMGKPDVCRSLLDEIREFQESRSIHGSELFDKYFRLLLVYVLETKSYGLLNQQIEEVKEGLQLYVNSLPWTSLSMLYFFMARIQFEQKDFSQARTWLDLILDRTNRGVREDITSLARILKIFTFYEEGDVDLVESQSRSTRKYLSRREQLHGFERRILLFLEKNSFQTSTNAELDALASLRTDLDVIFEDPCEAPVLRYFDIIGWLDARIQGLR